MSDRTPQMSDTEPTKGRFGAYGGQYVPETLIPALTELEGAFAEYSVDEQFMSEFRSLLSDYVGRPTPLYHAANLSRHLNIGTILLKREDLNHTGAHKINNAIGQAMIAKRLGKKRVIAETGAGQHGVATATAAALLGLQCVIYMGAEDIKRQEPNVFRMRLLGAEIHPVTAGQATLKEAISEAIRDWVTNVTDTYYLMGTAAGPHPYPVMVKFFQSVIGEEAHSQCLQKYNRLPTYVVACIGGGSNAIGIFSEFLPHPEVKLIGVEAGGDGTLHAATLTRGTPGVLHGNYTYILQDQFGRIAEAHSISAGLDYPGVGPEHSYLHDTGRVRYVVATDEQALDGFRLLTATEGILPALESSHAIAYLLQHRQLAERVDPDSDIIIVNLSGRGDKDMPILTKILAI